MDEFKMIDELAAKLRGQPDGYLLEVAAARLIGMAVAIFDVTNGSMEVARELVCDLANGVGRDIKPTDSQLH